jgi:hypothetical protein
MYYSPMVNSVGFLHSLSVVRVGGILYKFTILWRHRVILIILTLDHQVTWFQLVRVLVCLLW